MGGGHSCHDSVARRFCDVRSECILNTVCPKVENGVGPELECDVSRKLDAGKIEVLLCLWRI